jgi:diguanylate cyclase (GGDEF)-like protein
VDPALYRWSISALAASVAMIAVFFAAMWRSVGRVEMRWWTFAWVAESAALAIVLVFWYFEPRASLHPLVFGFYTATKTVYVWLLLRGALELCARRPRWLSTRVMVPAVVVFALLGALFFANTLDRLGVSESAIISVGFGVAALALLRSRAAGSAWLVVGFSVRSVLAAFECAAYLVRMISQAQPDPSSFLASAGTLLAVHTSFDTGTEWLIALGCVFAVSDRAQRELRQANAGLMSAQADLRRVADRDPLTALVNRRTLPEVLRTVQPHGAMLIFFDLDGFKRINDAHGHQAGDECLKRFATALTDSFRPQDAVVRYAGDEFLVIASGLDESAVDSRVSAVRLRMRAADGGEIPVGFSHGVARLAPGGDADEAIRAADEAMYRAKPRPAFSSPARSLQGEPI